MKPEPRLSPKTLLFLPVLVTAAVAACAGGAPPQDGEDTTQSVAEPAKGHGHDHDHDHDRGKHHHHGGAAVELAIEIDNGAGIPLSVKKGQAFFLNQVDMRASLDTDHDEGVSGLFTTGDFAPLRWDGTAQADQQFVLLPDANGKFTRQRFFRQARWMNEGSRLTLRQRDARGHQIGGAMVYQAGVENDRRPNDDFFDRRLRAIQWTFDCSALGNASGDCTTAHAFREEALVELRYAQHPDRTFVFDARTTSLEVEWSANPHARYSIPVTQVEHPEYAYGFDIDVKPVTPPRADGSYAPGSDVTFQMTLRDGEGKPLHPPGSLPTYNEVLSGSVTSGIKYYNAFFDPTTTYYRRKHRERMLMSDLVGPAQDVTPLRSIIDLDKFLNADDVQTTATNAVDGAYAQFRTFPTAHDLFGGAFQADHAAWNNPVPDTWTYHLPDDAKPGTYYVATKGRRVYLGQDIPSAKVITIQVGTTEVTHRTPIVGKCNTCHEGVSGFDKVLHGMKDQTACGGCHVPLGIELEGPIYVRVHFVHSRSNHFDVPKERCATCHLDNSSIQRTSKSACLSCHKSYPQSHVDRYGPIESMYYGGLRESFGQCSTTCHTTHPGSEL
jgi:hypothetical protein